MKAFKITVLSGFALAMIVLFVLRSAYSDKDELTVSDFTITGIQNGIGINCGDAIDDVYISVPDSVSFEKVISVSSKPDVAYIAIDHDNSEGDRVLSAKVITLSPGIAELYVKSVDESKVSEKFTVNVISDGAVSNTESPSASQSSTELPENSVYVTPFGTKYHLRSSCSGDGSIAVSLEDAVGQGYMPCKNCAMNK